MTEVPEHLLQRSLDRRKALGQTVEEGPETAVPPSETSAAPAVAQAQAPAATTASSLPELPELAPEPEPQPEPIKPWVQAALSRKKIPFWAMPVLIFLPFWAIIFAGTLETPERDSEIIALGREVYENTGGCAGCHGAEGAGGIGPALNDGKVEATFSDWKDHVIWIINGSPDAIGTPYGDNRTPSLGAANGMPSFGGDKLTPREILASAYYERVELSETAEADLVELEELFEAESALPERFELNDVFPSTLRGLLADAGIGEN